ncbi:T9SS type A sorting domain-containing protein [Pontibacter fetidus]|uniref:T9SS type A sorting domain-containing protein n=1 Tax=Pontibacter fetidus TaxID=2700082 RepID=A0A6B2H435_9BACT|nr:T9SS type A sorting domain-containing protein [Pontibacter fetidus]NDK56868.1 T9SS type A sorting domain-containing protein [Pontibacter fetidus]
MNKLYNSCLVALTPARFRVWLLFFSLFLTQTLFASDNVHMIPVSLQERVQAADMVVEGEVISKKSFWDASRARIYTSNIVKVYKVFKGTLQPEQLEVITEGGTVGLDKHVYTSVLSLSVGQQGMFFLQRQQLLATTPGRTNYSSRPYAAEQGFIRYNVRTQTAKSVFDSYASVEQVYQAVTKTTGTNYRTINTNQKLLVKPQQQNQRSAAIPVVTSFSPREASAGTKTVLTINGSGFGSSRGTGSVAFRNADDGGKTFTTAPVDAYLSWTNTQIKMYIPSAGSDDGTAGTGELKITAADGTIVTTVDKITIPFAYSNIYNENKSYQPRLIDDDGEGGYTIRFAPSMQGRPSAQEGFRRAMNSWICTTNVNWKIGAPITKESSTADGETIIRFAPGSDVGAGVLARTLSQYRGCTNTDTGQTEWWLSEFDMEINSNINWQYGPGGPGPNQFDFETVMLHELGHAHQLGHVILPNEPAIMAYSLEYTRAIRGLSPADIEGGRFIIARSQEPNFCDKDPMVPKTDRACEIIELKADYTTEGDVLVTWNPTSEANISRYIIERSANGKNFEDIGTVAASEANSFLDTDPLQTFATYRLRVVYTDNQERYSDLAVVINPAMLYKFEVSPNPVGAEEKFNILFLVNGNTPVQLYLYDMTGKVVRSSKVTFTDANMPLEFDLQGLAPGIYVLKWSSAKSSGTTKIMKL